MAGEEKTNELLFEIGTEELPSWYVSEGAGALGTLLTTRLREAGLAPTTVQTFATPRRLAALVSGLSARSAVQEEERRGPSAAAAFDAAGAPTRAASAFAAASGVAVADLSVRETERGSYVYAVVRRGGEPTAELLPKLLAGVVADLPAPRKMRWAEEPVAFVRPVTWLLALLGDQPLVFAAAGVTAGRHSRGHRFLAPGEVAVASAGDYLEALRRAWVLADPAERRLATLEAAREAALAAGAELYDDEALLAEVTNLIEWPFAVLGSFDAGYLELPDEVLATVMIKHQRFFPTRSAGRLTRNFVGLSNNRVKDAGLVRQGYERVLQGRLYDARFFWRSDLAKSLSQHAWALSGIAFQRDLGSMADKTTRVADVAASLADALALPAAERDTLAQALPLFRADLATEMVFEFPELEGEMARAYALAEGLPEAVAEALRQGVMPKGNEAEVPAGTVGALIAAADRLDKLVGFFAIGRRPSGSADPFALRRDALALLRIVCAHGWPVSLDVLVEAAAAAYREGEVSVSDETRAEVAAFVWDRLTALLTDQGHGVTVVRAAIAGSSTVLDAVRRSRLLTALVGRPEFTDLLALFKRAANLAGGLVDSAASRRGSDRASDRSSDRASELTGAAGRGPSGDVAETDSPGIDETLFREPPEAPLFAALAPAAAGAARLLESLAAQVPPLDPLAAEARPLTGLDRPLAQVLGLKAPLDAFLDGVLVMAEDAALRRNRLALLAAVVAVLRNLGALEELGG